jgi:hypothetical protein
MEELEKVLQALSIVERYDEYLYRKTWGRVLIIIGMVLPLGALVNMGSMSLAMASGFEATDISFLADIMTLVLCWGLVIFAFFESWYIIKQNPQQERIGSKHKLVIGIAWCATFTLAFLFPEPLRLTSILWAASVSCLFTFVNLRAVGMGGKDKFLLYLGLVLFLVSIPALLISGNLLSGYTVIIAFSVSFLLSGIALNRLASGMLRYAA